MKNLTSQVSNQTPITTMERWCTALFIVISFFNYGTAIMDYFLFSLSRFIVAQLEFVEYHALLEERILPISVIPFAVLMILKGKAYY